MNEQVRALAPQLLWNYFADLNAVPRASKKEQRVIAFMKAFGEGLGLPTSVDEIGNVLIKKTASAGMEDRQTIVLQSHLDMVHQKNSDTNFNFDTQGIDMYVDGDWVKARGTTLGADNGIGVAAIMSLLASTDIPHPALEALFTIDEETGMSGALGLKGGLLNGNILLNLDTEADNELTIGCAGGVDITISGSYEETLNMNNDGFRLTVKGLTGGHSGADIHLGRANANKIMNRILLLLEEKYKVRISSINGGSLRNAIPRESVAIITTCNPHTETIVKEIMEMQSMFRNEYHLTDPNLAITLEPIEKPEKAFDNFFQMHIVRAIQACQNGVFRMSPGIPGLVQSSNNLARVLAADGKYTIQCLTRSSVESEKIDLRDTVTSALMPLQGTITFGGEYPGWEPRPDSPIVQLMTNLYQELFHEPAHVNAVHAGLECGILGTNYPGIQMISFGPNIMGAHSPDERAQISSVQKFWGYLLEVLKRV